MPLYALRFLGIDESKKSAVQADLPTTLGLVALTHDREENDFILSPVVDIQPKEEQIREFLDSMVGEGSYILLNVTKLLDSKA